jgi:hypothetical protein
MGAQIFQYIRRAGTAAGMKKELWFVSETADDFFKFFVIICSHF